MVTQSFKRNRFLLLICTVAFLSVSGYAQAQFESEPISVALDNTEYQCYGDGFAPSTESFTKGGSSVKSFSGRPIGGAALAGCFIEGGKTITFDWKFTKTIDDEFILNARGEFGRSYELARLSETTDWQTVSVFLPNDVESFNWDLLNFTGNGLAWVDNLRVTSGQTSTDDDDGEFSANPLSRAVDNTDYNFLTLGDSLFFAQGNTKNTGSTSAQAGNIADNEASFLYTLVEGGTPISFDWKVSSEEGFDGAFFYYVNIDGGLADPNIEFISGESNWQRIDSVVPGKGLKFVVWVYSKDEIISRGRDTAWVDNVQIGENKAIKALPSIISLLLSENN